MAIKAKKKKVEEAKAPQPTSLIKFGSKKGVLFSTEFARETLSPCVDKR